MRKDLQCEEAKKPLPDIDDLIFGSAVAVPSER